MTPLLLDKIFGLPAHPLLVHGAVVLVPLAALALIVTGWREAWRRAYYLPITLIAIGGAVAAFLAKQSGEPLEESIRRAGKHVGDHPEQGDTAFVSAVILAGALVVLYAWQTWGDAIRERLNATRRFRLGSVSDDVVLWVISLPAAAFALYAMIAAGHSGATLVWKTNR